MENRNTAQQRSPTASLKDFLTILFKHKYKILLIFLVSAVAATLAARRIPPMYEAESTLLVRPGREYIYRPEVGNGGPVVNFNPGDVITAEIKILTSRDLVENVIASIGIENIYPGLKKKPPAKIALVGAAANAFEKNLAVEAVRGSNVIQVRFQHEDPPVAAKAVNVLVGLFREKHIQVYSDPQSSFIEAQARAYEEKLKESEKKLEAFKQQNQVFSFEEQRALLLKQRMDLEASLKNTQDRIHELETRLSLAKERLKTIPETKERYAQGSLVEIERNDTVAQVRSQLLNLQLKERELLEKYKENSRTIMNVRKEIQIVEEFLRQQEEKAKSGDSKGQRGKRETIDNPLYQDVEKETVKIELDQSVESVRLPILKQKLSEMDREIQRLNSRENQLLDLRREVSDNEKNSRTYLEKLEESRIGEDMDRRKMVNIAVIQEAGVPTIPIKDTKAKKIILVGFLLGGLLGFGAAYLSETLAQGLSTPESAEKRLGVAVLATFPYKKQQSPCI